MELISFSFFFALFIFGCIAWNEGSVDAYDYARKHLRMRITKDDIGETIYSKILILYRERSSFREWLFTWSVRVGTYIGLFFWKIYCLMNFDLMHRFTSLERFVMIVTIVIVPLSIFPFFYYSKFCNKIYSYAPDLAPRKWKDNLNNDGGVWISFRLRTSLLALGLILFFVQLLIIYHDEAICYWLR